ncbi:hypothetical protein KPH14_004628 [Odynerus spinipes]|uniref:Uncharacterized protein n=1 Tax=Odynerus spinipes TaxID=1348599 RepID=A0AAD9RM50_9HYME|nr:hypothetical protein KPH14_004628 [Odynerus spinipes]
MKIKTKSGLATTSISMALRATRFLEKASSVFGRLHGDFGRMDAAKRRMDQRKIDRQNRINENKMNEEEELRRFRDENLENELRELAKIKIALRD